MSEFFIKPIVKILMLKGEDAVSISNIAKTSTSGLTDTYEITLTDGTKKTFNVNNGKGIKSIAKTSTSGLVDTYTTTYNDNTTSTFTVKNGEKGETGSVETLEVGGRNLLTGTNNGNAKWSFDAENGSFVSNSKIFDDIGSVNGVRFDASAVKAGWGYVQYNDENVDEILSRSIGKKFTVSFDIKVDVSGEVYLSVVNRYGNDSMITYGKFNFIANEWKHVNMTGTVVNANKSNQNIYISLKKILGSAKYIDIANLKLERGEVATDWTPSLEDIEDTYATKSDVEEKNTALSERVNALEKADTGWDNLYHNDDGYSYVIAREKNGVFYIIGSSGSTGIKIPPKTSKVVATVPNIFWPRVDITFSVSLKGGEGSASGTITTDGKIQIYSTVETNYWGFCISYPVG